nr:hypothetical protein [Jiangella gansuensis]
MSGTVESVRVVDAGAVDPASDMPIRRKSEVDQGPWFVAESIEVRGRTVARDGAAAGAQDRRPHLRLERQRAGECRVHPTVHPPPVSAPQQPGDPALAQATSTRLVEADQPALGDTQFLEAGRQVHVAERGAAELPTPEGGDDLWTTSSRSP